MSTRRHADLPTRSDIALQAGVSPTTVGYYISGRRAISPQSRAKISEAMDSLGVSLSDFTPARRHRGVGVVAILFPSRNRGMSAADVDYVAGINDFLTPRDFQVLIWPQDSNELKQLAKLTGFGIVDGVIAMEVREFDHRIPVLEASGVPYCLIGRPGNLTPHTFVDADFEAFGNLAISHLSERGHRQVGVIALSEKHTPELFRPIIPIEAGAVREAIQQEIYLHFQHVGDTPSDGRLAVSRLLTEHPEITALVGLNPNAMQGGLDELTSRSLQIPDAISVISFGLWEREAANTVPEQSTIGVDGYALGRQAAEFLLARMEKTTDDQLSHLEMPRLVDRGSTAPARVTQVLRG